ncbi:MAG: hypothetical protein A3H98_13180 [Bacteroidetes bacterium RIFCSPLOWO2_02_FULL_36_8]|nr:MAG: hypothetical protein A3H98_13180 [Bacteroidetes bacterium RIFCSPLOWO2_02_FULL_36_8]OFY70247.1 MAG: hypothetical protein A3G23_08880 [Bacteroidetes bacterium RIFCSPLOWO2_12_FULL_37_12]
MNKKLLFTLSACVIIIIFSTVREIHSNGTGAPEGYSGAPGGNGNCTGCHEEGSGSDQPGWITSNIPVTGYLPDSTYTLTATATKVGEPKFGFEIRPYSTDAAKEGTLILTDPNATQLIGSGKYITHTATGTTGSGNKSWNFKWKAPAAGINKVTFYGAFVCANNNGSPTEDEVYVSTLAVKDTTKVGIEEFISKNSKINIYPNPGNGNCFIDIDALHHTSYNVSIVNGTGQIIHNEVVNVTPGQKTIKNIQLENNSYGTYIIKFSSNKEEINKPLIVIK